MSKKEVKAPAAPKPKVHGSGVVKAVNSGDSIVVWELAKAHGGPPPDREIYFSLLQAPRLGRRDDVDQPWAWESREFLRKKCIGQQVSFTIEHKTEGGREFGIVSLSNGVNLLKEIAAEGWAVVMRPPEGKEPRSELHAELIQSSEAAQEKKIGVFQEGGEDRAIRTPPKQPLDGIALYDKIKGKTHTGLVDYVRDGSTLRLILPSINQNILVKLSGAQAPNIPVKSDQQPEPFAKEAKFFTERHLLHREVEFTPKGLGRNNEVNGIVRLGGRDLSEELLRSGLATFVEWTAGDQAARYKQAQEEAQRTKSRIWRNFQAGSSSSGSGSGSGSRAVTDITGKVREIGNGNFTIVDPVSGRAVSITLASVVIPKMGTAGREDEPYAWEAKELLRSRLLGKRVSAHLDYVRTVKGKDGADTEREFWSVTQDKTDVAYILAERGLAKVVYHKADEPRAANYEQLVLASKRAESKNKGIWNTTTPAPVHRVNDLTQRDEASKKSAKQFLPFLERKGRVQGVVEYVFNAGHFKVYIPKEQCMIAFSLEGIRTPSPTDADPARASLAKEVLQFVKDKLSQRNVEIIVSNLDSKSSNFIGTLFTTGNTKKNFALTLLENGYATVFGPAAERSNFSGELYAAEEHAKRENRGLWTNYDPVAEEQRLQAAREDREAKIKGAKLIKVVVTEIVDGGWFFVHVVEDQDAGGIPSRLASLQDVLRSQDFSNFAPGFKISKSELYACMYEGEWYRVKVESIKDDDISVLYIDYGYTDVVSRDKIRPLLSELKQLPPQAKECFLAYLKVPKPDDDFGEDAAYYFRELVWGKTLVASIEQRDGERLYLSLGDPRPESEMVVNTEMVAAGLASVEKRPRGYNQAMIAKLRSEQEKAKKERLNLWQYGDFEDDDDY